MKKHLITKVLSILFSICLLCCFCCSCADTLPHTHKYNEQNVLIEFLANDATCESPAEFYYSCSCGKKGSKTFEYGEELGHVFSNYISDNNATYSSDGTKTATCSRTNCGKTHIVVDVGSKIKGEYTICFYSEGALFSKQAVEKGEQCFPPQSPEKTNYIFTGWYTTVDCTTEYDFSTPITANVNLYAGYTLDALSLTNTITTKTMNSIVKIYNKSYNQNWYGTETGSSSIQGSGFCFHVQNGYYYILTNCHVAQIESGYSYQELTVEDYKGNTYNATLYSNPDKLGDAISAAYDLAVLYISPSSEIEMDALKISSANPEIDSDVISLGAPDGQTNAITYGKVYKFATASLGDTATSESNVTFKVAYHNAKINHGSSGGPLLGDTLLVVGVNYAGNSSDGSGCAIPAQKVLEFLNKYCYT